MSKLTDTKRAFDKVAELLDQEIRKGGSNAKELQRHRDIMRSAFYLLAWAQFEHLAREKAKDIAEGHARGSTVDGLAWSYLKKNIKALPLRAKLDIVSHGNTKVLAQLNDDYDLRNEAAHNYKLIPSYAQDISGWLDDLEDLVGRF
jgi:hypothetical protein